MKPHSKHRRMHWRPPRKHPRKHLQLKPHSKHRRDTEAPKEAPAVEAAQQAPKDALEATTEAPKDTATKVTEQDSFPDNQLGLPATPVPGEPSAFKERVLTKEVWGEELMVYADRLAEWVKRPDMSSKARDALRTSFFQSPMLMMYEAEYGPVTSWDGQPFEWVQAWVHFSVWTQATFSPKAPKLDGAPPQEPANVPPPADPKGKNEANAQALEGAGGQVDTASSEEDGEKRERQKRGTCPVYAVLSDMDQQACRVVKSHLNLFSQVPTRQRKPKL